MTAMDHDNRQNQSVPANEAALVLASSLALLDGFIANQVFGVFPVRRQTGPLPITVIGRQIVSAAVDAQGYPKRIITALKDTTYACTRSGLETPLTDSEIDVYGTRELAIQHKSQALSVGLLTAREATAAALLQDTGTFGNANAAAKWDTGNGDPIKDIAAACATVRKKTGVPAARQRVAFPGDSFDAFCQHPAVRAIASAYLGGGRDLPVIFSAQQAAAMLGVGSVVVGTAVYDTANAAKNPVFADIWNKTKVVAFVPATPGTESVAVGYDLVWDAMGVTSPQSQATGIETNAALAFTVDTYREERAEGDIVRIKAFDQQLVTNANAAQIITNVL